MEISQVILICPQALVINKQETIFLITKHTTIHKANDLQGRAHFFSMFRSRFHNKFILPPKSRPQYDDTVIANLFKMKHDEREFDYGFFFTLDCYDLYSLLFSE